MHVGNHCYLYGTTELTKMEAMQFCKENGGQAVSFHSQEDQDEVIKVMNERDDAHEKAYPWLPLTINDAGR
jgi:hypothetical protein